ncbi:histone H1-delta-like [Mizuhopecten yessoensis]|uniref:Histone H1.6 n=1 Tax=Mizuhopecten yessoensis TaxID=6573 RepID=A0A210PYU8_MIZYE|nr:histone H1-delta-like [Mizuhopecten yessoensis]OWF41654.1 histone H1.6 [Mizuhopecten yessoensis]
MSAAAASPVKEVKKASKPKVPAAHPPFATMVTAAVGALKDKKGSSKIGIMGYIMANYKVGDDKKKVSSKVKTALKGGVAKGTLKQVKGVGATGSFKLGDKPKAVKKPKAAAKKVTKPKKAAATKPKKVAVAKKTKSPKKEKAAKKPAAKKVAKPKVKTPKKAGAQKPVVKKPAAKKAAAKKPAKK